MDIVTENCGALGEIPDNVSEADLAVKDIIAENKAYRLPGYELFTYQKCLGDSLRFRLDLVGKADTPA